MAGRERVLVALGALAFGASAIIDGVVTIGVATAIVAVFLASLALLAKKYNTTIHWWEVAEVIAAVYIGFGICSIGGWAVKAVP